MESVTAVVSPVWFQNFHSQDSAIFMNSDSETPARIISYWLCSDVFCHTLCSSFATSTPVLLLYPQLLQAFHLARTASPDASLLWQVLSETPQQKISLNIDPGGGEAGHGPTLPSAGLIRSVGSRNGGSCPAELPPALGPRRMWSCCSQSRGDHK